MQQLHETKQPGYSLSSFWLSTENGFTMLHRMLQLHSDTSKSYHS